MGLAQREKGKRGEREVVALLIGLGYTARRTQQYNGDGLSDVVAEELDLHIEVKRGDAYGLCRNGKPQYMLRQGIEQAQRDAQGRPWCVFFRRNGEPWALWLGGEVYETTEAIAAVLKEYER